MRISIAALGLPFSAAQNQSRTLQDELLLPNVTVIAIALCIVGTHLTFLVKRSQGLSVAEVCRRFVLHDHFLVKTFDFAAT